jgi:hypothetical protein
MPRAPSLSPRNSPISLARLVGDFGPSDADTSGPQNAGHQGTCIAEKRIHAQSAICKWTDSHVAPELSAWLPRQLRRAESKGSQRIASHRPPFQSTPRGNLLIIGKLVRKRKRLTRIDLDTDQGPAAASGQLCRPEDRRERETGSRRGWIPGRGWPLNLRSFWPRGRLPQAS